MSHTDYAGLLQKQTQSGGKFVRRYCQIVDGHFTYQKSRKDTDSIAKFGLHGAVITKCTSGDPIFIIRGGGAPREYRFKTSCKEELGRWVETAQRVADDPDTPQPIKIPEDRFTPAKFVTMADFTEGRLLGEGMFGRVSLLTLKSDPTKQFACKLMKKKKVESDNMVANTIAEKQILQALNHPYIVKLHYAFQDKDGLYLVLQCLPGGELFEHIQEWGSFTEERTRIYTAQIALSLDHIHNNDIVYRDLKPENIVLDSEGNACLTDFGIAKIGVKSRGRTNTFCGTPEYIAPELVDKVREGHGHAVDWWALGILIFEMLTGLPPFYVEDDPDEMARRIKTQEVTWPDDIEISQNCKDLIMMLLDRDQNRRQQNTEKGQVTRHRWFTEFLDMQKIMRREFKMPDWGPPPENQD